MPAHCVPGPSHLLWHLSFCGISKNLIPWKEKAEPMDIPSNELLKRPAFATPTPRADTGMAHVSWTEQVSVHRAIKTQTTSQKSLTSVCHLFDFVDKGCSGMTQGFSQCRKWPGYSGQLPAVFSLGRAQLSLGNNTVQISRTGSSRSEKSRVCIWRPWTAPAVFALTNPCDWLRRCFIWLHRHGAGTSLSTWEVSGWLLGFHINTSLSGTDAVWILFRRPYPLQAWP